MTHDEWVEQTVQLHEAVVMWSERAESAEAKLAASAEDTADLNWLEKRWIRDEDCPVMECDGKFFAPDSKVRTGQTLRAAIRAARGKKQ